MIDIRAELNKVRDSFISIYDFIYLAESSTDENLLLICQWMLKRIKSHVINENNPLNICFINQFHEIEYKFGNIMWGIQNSEINPDFVFLSRKLDSIINRECLPTKKGILPIEDNQWEDTDFFEFGFKKEELQVIFPELIKSTEIGLKDNISNSSNPLIPQDRDDKNIRSSLPELSQIESGGSFMGKDTALMLIAGLAIALEKTGGRFKRGGKLNKSAVINAAEQAINSYGSGVNVTNRALRDWLTNALNGYASKLED
ncbi:hypothetical protein QUF31_17545 [Dickeya chrysanthemi]|uniref:hypothetical protein n=1 Tax=Dickeya chrysanthemi TaxID=556 RepID=UPI0025A2D292|nr:hypothetical protein [Dickeya chrysanthemi]WJM84901.1 hypothetical protein QUF31_17545 [Dickeya chrysanthemi]